MTLVRFDDLTLDDDLIVGGTLTVTGAATLSGGVSGALTVAKGSTGTVASFAGAAGSLIVFDAGSSVYEMGTTAAAAFSLNTANTNRVTIGAGGAVFVNDSSNAMSTLGLTLNQGANDDEIVSWKSSDVSHGMTSLTEDDTYFFGKKLSATNGGVNLAGLSESVRAIQLSGVATGEDATRSTAGDGAIYLNALKKSGTTTAALAADKNMVVFANGGTTRTIFDSDGDNHADVSWVTF